MWFYLLVAALLVVGIVGGIFGGGIFTIVLVPVALIVLGASFFLSSASREQRKRAGAGVNATHTTDQPLPHAHARPTGRAPSSPEALADARRAQQ